MKGVVIEKGNGYCVLLLSDGTFRNVEDNNSYELGSVVHTKDTIHKVPRHLKKVVSMVAAVFVVAFLGVGVFAWVTPVQYINIDINPSVELKVNCLDRIINVQSLNDDGKELIKKISVRSQHYESGVNEVIEMAKGMGYLENKGDVLISISSSDIKRNEKAEKNIKEKVNEEVTVLTFNAEEYKMSVEEGLSPGKSDIIEKVIETDSQLNKEELAAVPVKDLMVKIQENSNLKEEEEARRIAKEQEEEAKRIAKQKEEQAKQLAKEIKEEAKRKEEEARRIAKEQEEKVKRIAKQKEEQAKQLAKEIKEEAKRKEEEAKRIAKEQEEKAKRMAKQKEEQAKQLAKEIKEEAKRKEEEAKRIAKEQEEEAKRITKKKEEQVKEWLKQKEEEVKQRAKEEEEQAKRRIKQKQEEAKEWFKQKEEQTKQMSKEEQEKAKQWLKRKEEELKQRLKVEEESFNQGAKEREEEFKQWSKQKEEEMKQWTEQKNDELEHWTEQKENELEHWTEQKKKDTKQRAAEYEFDHDDMNDEDHELKGHER